MQDFIDKIMFTTENMPVIDELYVQPNEYAPITSILKKERLLFISGTPEFGETYTAVKLLWEWYKNGYEVV